MDILSQKGSGTRSILIPSHFPLSMLFFCFGLKKPLWLRERFPPGNILKNHGYRLFGLGESQVILFFFCNICHVIFRFPQSSLITDEYSFFQKRPVLHSSPNKAHSSLDNVPSNPENDSGHIPLRLPPDSKRQSAVPL